jgi:hypothetical protein
MIKNISRASVCHDYIMSSQSSLAKDGCMDVQALFIGRSRLWISPNPPNISNRCDSVTFFVSFSTTIFFIPRVSSNVHKTEASQERTNKGADGPLNFFD